MKGAYAVFGAGSFGSKVATELSEAGHHVVVIDRDRDAVSAIREKVTEALVADVSNPDVIRELDVKKFDAVIMGMSSHFEDLILALTLIKQEGAKNIYVNFIYIQNYFLNVRESSVIDSTIANESTLMPFALNSSIAVIALLATIP